MPESKAAGRSQHKPIAHAFAHRSQKPAANGLRLAEVRDYEEQIFNLNTKI